MNTSRHRTPATRRGMITVTIAAVLAVTAASALLIAFPTHPAQARAITPHAKTSAASSIEDPASASFPAITIAAVGDSITSWHTPSWPMWTMSLSTGPVIVNFNDGWAQSGATLQQMADNVQPTLSDVVVVMGGVNDIVRTHTPIEQMRANLDRIVKEAHAPHVIVSAVAPLRDYHDQVVAWNVAVQQEAEAHGWTYIDPWTYVRGADGVYVPALTFDGVHPTAAASASVASEISQYVDAVAHHWNAIP